MKWCPPFTVLLCQCFRIFVNQLSNEIDGTVPITASSVQRRVGTYVSHGEAKPKGVSSIRAASNMRVVIPCTAAGNEFFH
jgi:hypothetical protein